MTKKGTAADYQVVQVYFAEVPERGRWVCAVCGQQAMFKPYARDKCPKCRRKRDWVFQTWEELEAEAAEAPAAEAQA